MGQTWRTLGIVLCGLAVFAASADETPRVPSVAQPLHFYYHLYPEWKVQRFGEPSRAGTDVGNLGTLRNDSTVLSRDATRRPALREWDWSNSYVAVRGEFQAGPVTAGYDLQGLVDFNGSFADNFRARDAFLWIEHGGFGRLSVGQMDTWYKEAGDPVRMLGISSGNIVGTSRIVSGVGWRATGATTFNNRVNRMLNWESPRWRGFNVAASHSIDPVDSVPGRRPKLDAAAVQWRSGPWYAALATEVHRDWIPMSLATAAPASTSVRNRPATVISRDQGWRLSGSWVQDNWRVGADVARLRYTEDDPGGPAGRFRDYSNTAGQVSVEYRVSGPLRVSAHHARAGAGDCVLSRGVACSTNGLGGVQSAVGAMWRFTDTASVFLLAVQVRNGPAASYFSAPQGGRAEAYALGVRLRTP